MAQVADSDRPLEGEAYSAAEEAYKTFSQGDYRKAAARAGEAVTLRPDILRLRLLLIDALVAPADLTQSEQAATGAAQIFAPHQAIEAREASSCPPLARRTRLEGCK